MPQRRPAVPETITIRHGEQTIVVPVERSWSVRRASIRMEGKGRKVFALVRHGEKLAPVQALAQRIAGRIAAWLQGDHALRNNEERIVLEHAGEKLPLLLQRSPKARRISLRVKPARREIVLVVPLRAAQKAALDFARREVAWIRSRLAQMPQASPFVEGAEVPLRGVPHRIRHRADRRGTVWLENGEIHVAGDPRHLARRVGGWLVTQANREIPGLVRRKADRLVQAGIGRKLSSVSIRDTVSRWGSCGADGSIMLSWRMILAPPPILDYLIAHEVAHLVEQNHSTRFWQMCAELCDGDVDAAEAWLKKHGAALLQYGAQHFGKPGEDRQDEA